MLRTFLRSFVALSLFSGIILAPASAAQQRLPYRDSSLPVDQRVADLLSRMTLEEKVAQLVGTWQSHDNLKEESQFFIGSNREFLPDRAAVLLKDGLGEIAFPGDHRGPREMAEFTNTVQKWFLAHTRLGIPVLFHEECLHGHAAVGGTSYPQAIALASTWDTSLVHDVFSATAQEVRARGAQQCFAPVLDLAREPRWGRTEETYGEDPYLTSRIGVAAVQGFQGNGPAIDRHHVMATTKHFAVHGQPEGGTNAAPGNYSERVVREYFLKPFQAAIVEAHAASVMPSYNEIDGIPSHSNQHLLDDILRHEWGFQGLVVSDYFALNELNMVHHVVANDEAAARVALQAGVDVELPDAVAYRTLSQQVRDGNIPESLVDRAVSHVLRAKFLAGLFENPYVDLQYALQVTNSPEHKQLALQAAREAIILLKNQDGLLPLDRSKLKRIAVIGPNAAEGHLGGYSDGQVANVSVLQGVKNKLGSSAEVLFSEGCRITESPLDWYADKVVLGDSALNVKRIQEAVQVARKPI
jgi:beta-glucosidase